MKLRSGKVKKNKKMVNKNGRIGENENKKGLDLENKMSKNKLEGEENEN